MKQERLNDELTIVGLILLLLFIIYQLVIYTHKVDQLSTKVVEAQRVAIFLDQRLTSTEQDLELTQNSLESLTNTLDERKDLEKILKDIATSWEKPKN